MLRIRRLHKRVIENLIFLSVLCVIMGVVGFGIGMSVADVFNTPPNTITHDDVQIHEGNISDQPDVVLTPWVEGVHTYPDQTWNIYEA